jgi:two-component system cell cycle response regulator
MERCLDRSPLERTHLMTPTLSSMRRSYPARVKAKALVVEDSPTQRAELVRVLEQRGYEVDSAAGGLEALARIKRDPPDVVVLDVVLDGMDGYSVCRWLRLGESTRDIVVIMLTSKTEVKERVEGLHVGADDYVAKPFDADELEARMFAALRSRNARLELRRRNADLEGMLTRTEQLAMTDAVTGIFNRRRFVDMLGREFATARRYGHPLSLMLLDLDGFKAVNDTDGHAAGDDVLRHVAQIVSGGIREVDACARYGGDEFGVILPHTEALAAEIVADRIRARLEHEREEWEGAASHVSLSVGIASTADSSLKTPEDLVEAADRALYEAKRAGRDRVIRARPGILGR